METASGLQAKIAKLDAIISSLMDTALVAVANGDTVQYNLDTGQTKISKVYNEPSAILNAIKGYETLRKYYINQLTPRNVRLVDSRNFIPRRYGRN
jgi:hypothetical protein